MDEKFGFQRLSDFLLPEGFRGKPAAWVQFWWIIQGTVIAWSPQFLYSFRRNLTRSFGARLGRDVLIRPSVKITYPWKLAIGDHSWIGDEVTLYTLGEIQIGSNTVISQKSYICTGSHDYTSPTFDIVARPVHIGSEVWIGTDVFVAPGVTIGDGAVVGARSTVLHDLPGGMVCYGSPAKPVRARKMKE